MSYDDDRDDRGLSVDPDVDDRGRKWPGLAALALFGVMAWVFVGAEFGQPTGFPDGASITASIGYAMFNIGAEGAVPSEGLLVPFEIIDLVLVAALVGAVMLARRDDGGEITAALRSDAVEQESSSGEVVADGGERTVDSQSSSDRMSDGGERSAASRTSKDERSESLGSVPSEETGGEQ